MISDDQRRHLDQIVDKIKRVGVPLVYAIGTAPFLDLELSIKPPVLIPRPETEFWCADVIITIEPLVEQATPKKPFTILDLCTGSGCIALAIASRFSHKNVAIVAIDNSPNALDCAQLNAAKYEIANCSFMRSDLYEQLAPGFLCDLIVTNPPYVTQSEFPLLDPAVRYWEDYHALVGGRDGLDIIRQIVAHAGQYLRPDYKCAQLWCEIGHQQGPAVSSLFEKAGFNEVIVMKDIRDRDRVVRGIVPCLKD